MRNVLSCLLCDQTCIYEYIRIYYLQWCARMSPREGRVSENLSYVEGCVQVNTLQVFSQPRHEKSDILTVSFGSAA